MADNIAVTEGSGKTVATDDVSGVQYQIVKLATGADGSASLLSNAAPLPISDAGGAITVDGTVAVSGTVAVTQSGTWDEVGINDSGNSITVDGSVTLGANSGIDIGDVDVTSVIPGTGATNLGKAVDNVAGATDTGVLMLAVRDDTLTTLTPADGDYTQLRVDSTGALQVNAKLISGSNAIQGTQGHDAAVNSNPVMAAGVAVAHGTNPTQVAAQDVTRLYANRHGILFTIGGHPNLLTKNLNVTDADGAQTNTDIIGAISTGTKYVVTHLAVTADNANTGDVAVRIGFGASAVPAADAAGIVLAHPGIAPGSGVVLGNGAGILGIGGDGEELRVTCEDPAGGAIDITVGYYTIES